MHARHLRRRGILRRVAARDKPAAASADHSRRRMEPELVQRQATEHSRSAERSPPTPSSRARSSAATGRAGFTYVDRAIDAALAGQVAAVSTAPLNKEALHAAGINFPGHTEIFAARTNAPRSCMMQYSEEITCTFVTVHVGYREVPGLLTKERILDVIELTAEALHASAATSRKSSSAASIRTPASTACSATAKKNGSSFRRSKPPAPKASRSKARCRPIRRSCPGNENRPTPSSACITTRGTSRSRPSRSIRP